MRSFLFKTDNNYVPLVLRLAAGTVMVAHGSQKLFGLFGGYGFTGTMGFFTGTIHLPWIIAFLEIIIEFFGAIALLLGLATRLTGLAFMVILLGIVFTSHIQYGFFMNWFGNQKGEGIEYFILYLAIAISLIISGGGRYSLDRYILLKLDNN
ncbi:DoxX family protein [Mucilaginibacter corticis]|uniref:DoxX family protein n=1 Tax=Mucilaginibacter corticis TaxID=2597670 RepID=A0A556MRN7_9SPHI|nr:DoxX family protein [Mucilaginibacter corticis]TSJ42626.1 DoxX family protein [Mucilaginibacter corticis]